MSKPSKIDLSQQAAPVPSEISATMEDFIQERINTWKEKKKREETGVQFTTSDSAEDKTYKLATNLNSKDTSSADILSSLYSTLSGSGNSSYTHQFLNEAIGAMINHDNTKDATSAANAFQGGMISMNPQDAIEAQLCAKLMVLHTKAMYFVNMARTNKSQKLIDYNLNNATKCMRLHNETLETLSRYRRKGEQRVKVVHQYVQVNNGGKAVVAGDFSQEGEGQIEKSKEVSHANQ